MMQAYRHGSHTVYQCHYHFVFIPKYRKPVLRGEVGLHLRELIREICKAHDIEILQGHIRPDHVHLLLSVPPTLSPSRVMNAIKGRSSSRLMRNFRTLNRTFWGRHLCSSFPFWRRRERHRQKGSLECVVTRALATAAPTPWKNAAMS